MAPQEFTVVIPEGFSIDPEKLQQTLEELFLATSTVRDKIILEVVHINDDEWPLSVSVSKLVQEAGQVVTAWVKRGPGWYQDVWLMNVVETLVANSNKNDKGEIEQTGLIPYCSNEEIMALHRTISKLEKQLDESLNKEEELKLALTESAKASVIETVFIHDNNKEKEESEVVKMGAVEKEPVKEIVEPTEQNHKYEKLLEKQLTLLGAGEILPLLRRVGEK